MANLMLTKQCNLHCSYCFANEFVDQRQSEVMSMENFRTCLRFLNPQDRLGLIGGEPTLHPQFQMILAELIDSPFQSVCLFTNGILLDRYFTELRNSRFQILVNLNHPDMIGRNAYQRILDNLDEMVNHLYMRDQVGIGLNIYSTDMDFSFVLEALKLFRLRRLRLSLTIPNTDSEHDVDAMEYFQTMHDTVIDILRCLLPLDIAPVFDCNYVPRCLFTKEDEALFSQYESTMKRSNLYRVNAICAPVLDILPDLRVVRCFGVSSFLKVNLLRFQDSNEIQRHFLAEIDALAYHIPPNGKCADCNTYLAGKCSCGCYAYRLKKMRLLREQLVCSFGKHIADSEGDNSASSGFSAYEDGADTCG